MKIENNSKSIFNIGDIVKPTEKALERNKDFTSDKRFIITKVDCDSIWDEGPIWYELAEKGDTDAMYCLPENEMELVKKFEW